MSTELSRILDEHKPVRVDFRTRDGQPIRKPFLGLERKPVWYVQDGRACVFGPVNAEGVRPVLFIEKRKSAYKDAEA